MINLIHAFSIKRYFQFMKVILGFTKSNPGIIFYIKDIKLKYSGVWKHIYMVLFLSRLKEKCSVMINSGVRNTS